MKYRYFFKPKESKESNVTPKDFDTSDTLAYVYTYDTNFPLFCEKWRVKLYGRNKEQTQIAFFLDCKVDNYDHKSDIQLKENPKEFIEEKEKAFVLPIEYFVR